MYQCPECTLKIKSIDNDGRRYWGCRNCGGRMIGFGALPNLIGQPAASELWRLSENIAPQGRPCPSCSHPLRTLLHEKGKPSVELDICRNCYLLWLDQGEDGFLAPKEVRKQVQKTPEQMREYAEALAGMVREREERRGDEFISRSGPDEAWKWVPALVGLPVELETRHVLQRPHLSWLITGTAILVYLATFWRPDLQAIHTKFGFLSELPFRSSGITWVTSFFLHGGLLHLISNMYFFLVFADDVEDDVSPLSFLALIFGSHFAGLLAQSWMMGASQIPVIGASAGVFGVLAYYMIRFPRAKVGVLYLFFFYPIWFRFSARWLVLIKVLLEILYSYLTGIMKGGGVAHAAHVGGAVFGLLFAMIVRSRAQE